MAVTVFQVSQIFGSAYGKAATVNAAVNGFKKAGICPLGRSVFKEHEFTPAEVTGRPDPSTSQVLTDDIVLSTYFVSTDKTGTFNNMPECSVSCLRLCYEKNDIFDSTVFDHTHDRNIGTVEVSIATEKKISTHTQHQVKVTDINAFPKRICDNKITTNRKNQSKTIVLTSSADKNLIKSWLNTRNQNVVIFISIFILLTRRKATEALSIVDSR